MESQHRAVARRIFDAYFKANDGDVQGLCALIASDIAQATGGAMVAGHLHWATNARTHWWAEADGETLDPMGDWQMEGELFHRSEAHRDQDLGREQADSRILYQLPERAWKEPARIG